jgi:hypothetical protein
MKSTLHRAAAGFAAFALVLSMPACTVFEEALGNSETTTTQKEPLEPAAPPPTAAAVNAVATSESPVMQGTPPLVVIRFDSADVAYEKPLYEAMNATLAKQPGAMFYVVAIAPPQVTAAGLSSAQTQSAKNVERVVASMTKMGLPASRISVASTTNAIAQVNEVRVFVR